MYLEKIQYSQLNHGLSLNPVHSGPFLPMYTIYAKFKIPTIIVNINTFLNLFIILSYFLNYSYSN